MLKETYIELLSKYSSNSNLILDLWFEVEAGYSNKKRHYHTLHHLDNLLLQLAYVKNEIISWDTILFSLYYHDIIYNPLKSDNEEKSSAVAEARMKQISVPDLIIKHCKEQILATKNHLDNSDTDTNYFTDADLSILGQDWNTYSEYYKNVRKEYSIYPDLIYNPGRRKVLKYFLEMPRIFKTEYFHSKFEHHAKTNIHMELGFLL